ncbi:RHS/YD repeat-containing protein [Streptomyces lincolnensis]|uniref:RHS/YD repeat-containing protein n=1 Tax=Streptomyces lincolnensis TaxID=1915 RepID=A0A1B1MEB2_STRLN|nr:RHS repeat-associated core domain-containing protein [Streptomyces lincolnensis]ANS66948.1 RHS/YD repeat-containing protein [Streptomyces lincolnensis]AXG55820.1 RHS/YD repeat-containing protein [Streptomyces lincolnensis]QMV07694.1 type IV secretion protein Rhs [Streptomyces lincolnensis]
MGIGDFISDITPDSVENAVEDGVEWAGNRVEDAGNWTADRLNDVGWESGADWVREQSRSLANRMGAEVDEMDLGQTEDKTKLIHGSAGKIDATVAKLLAFQSAFDDTGDGLKGLDSSRLKGEAAEALRTAVGTQPPKWYAAADACAKAIGALEAFASTVTWAQGQAQTAIDKWKEGVKASEDAADAHRKKVDDYNGAVDRYNAQPADKRDPASLPPKPAATFDDPGKKLMQDAQDILAEARKQRNTAAETARTAVRAARDMAPEKPSYAEQLNDGVQEFQIMGDHVGGGIIKGTAGILNFVRSVNPTDPYNLTHPAEYATSLNSLAAGLVVAANDPVGTGKQMLDTFMKDPAEGIGRLIPDLALTLATGGGGAAVKGVRVAEEAADAARLRNLVDDAPDGTHNTPDGDRTAGGDPVDLATGRMYLPQTDVDLPGILPLVFTRRTESGLAIGRFLGPSWTSTVDERLTIDAIGVLHVTAEGLLVSYPHPVPGAPTTPDSGRARTLLARDADGDYTVTDPDSGLTFHFAAPPGSEPGGDGDAWLTGITERNGHTITVDRTEDGLPLALVHSAGHRVKLSTADGLVTALSLAGAGEGGADLPLMSYGYQDGDLTAVTKPSGATTTFVYDDRHRVTAWIDSNGHRYDYVYDDRDRVVAEGGEAGHVQLTLAYTEPDAETGHRTTTLTTADGHATRHLFGPGCRLLAVTDPLGHTTRFTYDRRGNLRTRTDPLGLTTVFSYDEDGRVVSATRPDGSELRTVRGPFGLPVEVVGPDGTRMVHEFDDRGNRTAVTDRAGSTTRYTYDHAGRLTSVTDALGATSRVVCDASGLTVAVTDPAGAVTRTERDALGRPVRVIDPAGAVTRYQWHADGQLARRTRPDGATESWTYDGEGNLLTRTDAAGGVSRFEYTHFDLPLASTGPDGARFEFDHDAELRLTRVRNALGQTWTYAYDAAGSIVSETDFAGRTLSYEVDAAGRLTARRDALGGTISFERDPLDQVIRKDVDGRVTTYGYDRAGRLLEAVGPDSELRYQYDRRGLTKTELVDGRPILYAYDVLGRRTRRTTPTGHVTSYAYGADGLPQRLTSGDHRIDFTHDTAGRELSRVFAGPVRAAGPREPELGDSITMSSAWDEAGRLATQHIAAPGRDINSRAYSYRADGHLTSVADRLSGTRTFDLDRAGRVTAVHARGWTERYAYDDAGNQTSASWPSGHPGHEATGARTYTGTALTRAGDVRFEYDALGRVTLRQKTRLSRKPDTWRYTWDTENRLTSVTTPDGARWRYRYDPLGRRTAKQRLSADGESVVEEVRFTWDGLTLCEQTSHQVDAPSTVALTWDHRSDVPLAQTERILTADDRQEEIDRRFFAIATDLIGTPTELIDETGAIAWRTRSTLWGTTAWSRDSSAYIPLRFPGQYYDPETGLHYNYFRHYDPETGRYTSPDPLGLAPAPNPDTYVDNPLSACDPLGLMPKYTKEERAQKRINKVVDDIVDRAQDGEFRKRHDYHGDTRHDFSDERVVEILKNPDAVYHSTGTAGTFTFRQGDDIVVIDGPGTTQGQAITAYGPSGVKGESGATALGGKPTDPGAPVTHEDIVNGRIPAKDGRFQPPAVQIR